MKNSLRNRRTIVFADESGFKLQPTIRKTWAPRGQTPIFKCDDRRDRLTVVSALSIFPQRRRSGLLVDILDHNLQVEDFDPFVPQLLRRIRGPVTFVIDRLGAHRAAQPGRDPRGLPGPSSWPGWERSFPSSARTVAATSG